MSNKTVDKRDIVINQAQEILLNLLKEHIEDELCNYLYFELTLGECIAECYINHIKKNLLKTDGTFKVKKFRTDKTKERYSMDNLLDCLIEILNNSFWTRKVSDRLEEIGKKYGYSICLEGIGYYLRKVLLNVEEKNVCYNNLKKMIDEYILS